MSTLNCLPIETQFSPATKLLTFIHDVPFHVFLDFSLTFDGKLLRGNSHNPLHFMDAKKGPQNRHNQCPNFCHELNARLTSWSVLDTRVKIVPFFFGCRSVFFVSVDGAVLRFASHSFLSHLLADSYTCLLLYHQHHLSTVFL